MDMENEELSFTVTDNEGREIRFDVLFSYESPETGKNYIVYTDNTLDDDGNTKVYASIFEPDNDTEQLLPIETEEEWAMIEKIIEKLQNDEA